jgi:hypothetical protein
MPPCRSIRPGCSCRPTACASSIRREPPWSSSTVSRGWRRRATTWSSWPRASWARPRARSPSVPRAVKARSRTPKPRDERSSGGPWWGRWWCSCWFWGRCCGGSQRPENARLARQRSDNLGIHELARVVHYSPARARTATMSLEPRDAGCLGANLPRPPRTLRDRAFRVPLRSEKPGPLRRARRRHRCGVAWSESSLCHSPRIWPHPPFGPRLPPRSRSRPRRGVVDLRSGVGDLRRIVVHNRSGVVDLGSSVLELHPGAESPSREADGAGSGADGARQGRGQGPRSLLG